MSVILQTPTAEYIFYKLENVLITMKQYIKLKVGSDFREMISIILKETLLTFICTINIDMN